MDRKSYRAQNILYTVVEYIFVILVILHFRTMWLHSADYSVINTKRLVYAIVAAGLLCCLLKGKANPVKLKRSILLIMFTLIYISLHILIRKYSIYEEMYFLLLLLTMIVYHAVCDDENNLFYIKFSNVVFAIAIISILFWIFGTTLGLIHPTGTIYTTWTSNTTVGLRPVRTYYDIYFEAQTYGMNKALGIATKVNLIRNTGIFTEAPMFSFVLSLALLIELFIRQRMNKFRCGVFIFAIITSFSTTGYIMVFLAVSIKYYFTHQTNNIKKIIKTFLTPAMAIVGMLAISFLVESKLGTGSGSVRVDDFVAGYLAWRDQPLFGNGFGNIRSYQQYMSSFRRNNLGLSNSPMLILAYGGIMLLVPYLIAIGRGVREAGLSHNRERMAFIILFTGMLLFTIAPFQALSIYVLMEISAFDRHMSAPDRIRNINRVVGEDEHG